MRWLGSLGVVVLVFIIYLLVELRSSTTSSAGGSAEKPADEPSPSPVAAGDSAPTPPRATIPSAPIVPRATKPPTATPSVPIATNQAPPPDGDPPAEPTRDLFETTNGGEQPSALRVRIRGAQQYLSRGSYKKALEAVTPTIAEYPEFTDAYKVAIPALCAMGDPKAAQAYMPRLPTDADRTEMLTACAELGTKLTP